MSSAVRLPLVELSAQHRHEVAEVLWRLCERSEKARSVAG
jgi:hypothetical protein